MNQVGGRRELARLEVDEERLVARGVPLALLVADLEADLRGQEPPDTPADGWRILDESRPMSVVIGAPVDPEALSWRIGQVSPRIADQRRVLSLHPTTFPVLPSRAQRAGALTLKWPEVTRSEPDVDRLSIDIINIGSDRWRPQGDDSFHVAAEIVNAGASSEGVSFAWIGGTSPALPLDPGEYARVRVHLGEDQWRKIEPGLCEIRAYLVDLGLRNTNTLEVELTSGDIDTHRTARVRPGPPRTAS